jgi:hypothetical protein
MIDFAEHEQTRHWIRDRAEFGCRPNAHDHAIPNDQWLVINSDWHVDIQC